MPSVCLRNSALALFAVVMVYGRSYHDCGDHWCRCSKAKKDAVCEDHGTNLTFIPTLPPYITTLTFTSNHLPVLSARALKNISRLHLFALYLARNSISTVNRDAFSAFPNLLILDLSVNRLTRSLREVLRNLSAIPLTNLTLDNSDIQGSTYSFQQLQSATLRSLSIDHNRIVLYNHSDFDGLPELNTLSLGHNLIHNPTLSYSPKMKTLNLRDNIILIFPNFCDGIHSYFPNLTRLKLDHNSLMEIDVRSLKCLRSLVVFSINSNKLMHLKSNTFSDLPHLQYIILRNIIGGNFKLEPYAFNNSNIKYISLVSSDIIFKNAVHPDAFRGCSNMDSLDVSYNIFTYCTDKEITLWFGHLISLTGFGMGYTRLKFYPTCIYQHLINLKFIKLFGNLITSLPADALTLQKNMTHFWLGANSLSDIKENVFHYEVRRRLKVVDFSRNPFACNCDLLWFINWMKKEHYKFTGFPQRYHCAGPVKVKGNTLVDVPLTKAACLMPQPISLAILGTSVLLLVAFVSTSLVYKWRWHVRYYLYVRMTRPGDLERLETADIKYDAYVIYNVDDISWIKQELIANLETDAGFQLYIRDRDSLAGDTVTENIVNNMAASGSVLVVLSNALARDEVCQFELMFVQGQEGRRERPLHIVIVLLEEVHTHNMTHTVYALINMHSYVCWGGEPQARELVRQRLEHSLRSIRPQRAVNAAHDEDRRMV